MYLQYFQNLPFIDRQTLNFTKAAKLWHISHSYHGITNPQLVWKRPHFTFLEFPSSPATSRFEMFSNNSIGCVLRHSALDCEMKLWAMPEIEFKSNFQPSSVILLGLLL